MRPLVLVLAAWLPAAAAISGQCALRGQDATTRRDTDARVLARAEALLRDGKIAEALPLVEQYLQKWPDSPDGHTTLGFIFFTQSKPAESLREYAEAAKYRSLTAFELKIVGLSYAIMEDYANADRGLTKSLELNPKDLQTCNDLGEVKFLQAMYEDAITVFGRCLLLDPKNVFAGNGLGSAFEQTDQLDKAVAAYRDAVAWQSGMAHQDPTPLLNLGRLLMKLRKTEEAMKYLTRAVELGPQNAKAHEQLGRAHSYAGELEAAQRELKKAIELNPEDAHLHYVLAQLYQRAGMTEKAKHELEQFQSLKKRSDNPPEQ
jgi:tetratricopeptide (TPR) repeat protein